MFSPASHFDAELAARLNDVPLPCGLIDRLQSIPLADDAELDAELGNVAVPTGLTPRLSAIASAAPPPWAVFLKEAAAAVLAFGVGLSYVLSVIAFFSPRFEPPALAGDLLQSAVSVYPSEPALEQAGFTFNAVVEPASSLADAGPPERIAASEIAMNDEPIVLAAFADFAAPASPTVSIDDLDAWSTERLAVHLARPGSFDENFWRRTGLLPWLDVGSEHSVEVELLTDDAGYRRCRREIRQGKLPVAAGVRTEEFVAAFDYGLSDRVVNEPTIVLAAAPSPFGGSLGAIVARRECRRWLMMIAVALPDGKATDDPPRLSLHFAPQRVKAYRIIGYGPPQTGGTGISQTSQADDVVERAMLPVGETATVLVEIELVTAEDQRGALGGVRMQWHDGEGTAHTESVISTDSFSNDFDSAPVAWRQATLVALAAENLAGSPFAEEVSLAEIAAFARRIEPLVVDRAGWREFIEMVLRAQSLRSSLLRAF